MGWGVWGKQKWGKEEEELSDWRRRRRRRRRRRKKQDVGRYPMGPTMIEYFSQDNVGDVVLVVVVTATEVLQVLPIQPCNAVMNISYQVTTIQTSNSDC